MITRILAVCLLLLSQLSLAASIQVGDVLRVELPGESSLNQGFAVDRSGHVLLPEVGQVKVAGLSEAEAEAQVHEALKTVLRDLSRLRVYVSEQRLLVQVLGYVKQPGEVIAPVGSSVQAILHLAGGVRSGAQLDRLQLRRGEETLSFNYKAYLDSGDFTQLPRLQSLDQLFVPASPMIGNVEMDFNAIRMNDSSDAGEDRQAVKVFGEVNRPGSFAYKPDMTLVDWLMRAGGVTRYAGVEQIRIISDNAPRLFNLTQYLDSGDRSLIPEVKPGATLFIPKQVEEIQAGANTVYIMGEVFKPGAYEGKEGAGFLDILANAGGPSRFAETRQIRLLRADGSVERFDLQAFTEGRSRDLPPIAAGDAIFVPEKTDINEKSWLKVSPDRAVRVMGEVLRPGRFEWSDEMSLLDLMAHAGGPKARADIARIQVIVPQGNGETHKQIFDLKQFLELGLSDEQLPTVRAGATIMVPDLPQDPSDNKSQWVRQASDDSIYVFGQVGAPGRYRFDDSLSFLDILSAANGPNGNADIRNIRISHRDGREARVTRLDLALYFETGDEHLLPRVMPGDTIYIPEKNRVWLDNSKESTVRVLGAINRPGRYEFDDHMTLLDLLAEAGGPSGNAYLERITVINLSCCRDQARTFDLASFAKTADFASLPVLRAGDTVYIPSQGESAWSKARQGLNDLFQIVSMGALLGLL